MLKMRELSREDIPEINRWRENHELIALLGSPYRYIAPEVDLEWFDSYLKSRSSTVRCVTVDDSEPNIPLCLTTLAGIDWVSRSCTLHIMVGNKVNQGKGVGSFSASEMIQHAFMDLNLRRVELTVLESNTRALKLYEKLGFSYEGTKRKAKYKDGTYVDMIMMALLRDEWQAPAKKTAQS